MSWTLAATLTALLFAPEFPVTARLIHGPTNQVELKNIGPQAVTAWAFAVVSPTATGTHREVHSADVYLSAVTRDLPQSPAHLDWLRPDQTRAIPVDTAPSGASVEIVALVFEDGTSLGDADTIASFFAHRAAERDQLKDVVDTFNTALQTKHGAALLDELRQRLAAPGHDGSVPHRTARDAVETWAQRAKSATDDDVDRSVRTYAAFVTKQYETALKHASTSRR